MKRVIAMTLVLILCLSLMSVSVFAAPDGLSRLAVVGSGIPGVSEWDINDPAGDMTEVSESVYEKTLVLSAGTEMRFKIATDNGSGGWNDAFNFGSATLTLGSVSELENGGGTADMYFKAEKDMTIKVTVDLNPLQEGGKATILLNEPIEAKPIEPTDPSTPEEEVNTVPSEKYTLTVEVPESWTSVYVYTWDDNDYGFRPFGEYPGSAMLKKVDNTYEFEIDANIQNLIISDGDFRKTDDLKVRPGCDIKIVVTADCRGIITYPGNELPRPRPPIIDPVVELSEYRVVGNTDWLGNWDPAFEGGRMHKIDDNCYRVNFADVAPGSYEIKITKDGKWGGDIGDNGNNFCFTVDRTCNITVDLVFHGDVGIIEVYGPVVWWDEDEDQSPDTGDTEFLLPMTVLFCTAAAFVLLLRGKKHQ